MSFIWGVPLDFAPRRIGVGLWNWQEVSVISSRHRLFLPASLRLENRKSSLGKS